MREKKEWKECRCSTVCQTATADMSERLHVYGYGFKVNQASEITRNEKREQHPSPADRSIHVCHPSTSAVEARILDASRSTPTASNHRSDVCLRRELSDDGLLSFLLSIPCLCCQCSLRQATGRKTGPPAPRRQFDESLYSMKSLALTTRLPVLTRVAVSLSLASVSSSIRTVAELAFDVCFNAYQCPDQHVHGTRVHVESSGSNE